uniref:Uncharacterized protein n=1 Tax=Trypanosoma vivax (strain Y486) TaxID=1055687 RepID=G0U645_TRYVY|nr:conserved hypothetical protein [Trypanosoma vivax Y486]
MDCRVRRPLLPRGARAHLSITAWPLLGSESPQGLGAWGFVKAAGGDGQGEKNVSVTGEGKVHPVLTGLIATCGRNGTSIMRHTQRHVDTMFWQSPTVPSNQKICYMQLLPSSRLAMLREGHCTALFPSPQVCVADVVGNVFMGTFPASSVEETNDSTEAPVKRQRREVDSTTEGMAPYFWQRIAAAEDAEGNSYGACGWCGLAFLSDRHLVCCREFFFDLRLLDAEAGGVVRQYGTTHTATGVAACPAVSPYCAVVAEGPLATLYDVRCPGVVLTQSEGRAALHGTQYELVTGRFTHPTETIADVCVTGSDYEVVLAVGRAVCVHDVRKWVRTGISTNVLKYDIGSIAPFAGGRAVVAVGIDAEARQVPLCSVPTVGSSSQGNVTDAVSTGPLGNGCGPSTTSFRNRIGSSLNCMSTWQGGWVSSLCGTCATGISADHEFFTIFNATDGVEERPRA